MNDPLVQPLALGLLAGGLWNLANLYCLTRLLTAWLGPPRPAGHDGRPPRLWRSAGRGGGRRSTRRVVGWLLVKFIALYVLAFALLRLPGVSPVGFGVGFTVVLIGAVWLLALRARRLVPPVAHDR